jgi:hypothetical protein
LTSFMDELMKISSNMAAPPGLKSGTGANAMVTSTPRVGLAPQSKNPEAKSTNYSIVHSEAPSAAAGSSMATKASSPPAVRT